MDIRYILFDLDETLYPSASGLLKEIDRRITAYTASFLGVGTEEAASIRKGLYTEHGTTLKGLIEVYGFDRVDEYLDMAHPENVSDYLSPDPELDLMLRGIPQGKSILTNSPREHAERVLAALGVRGHFQHIFDLKSNGYAGKPAVSCYRNALEGIGRKPEEVLFLDDRLDYLTAFRAMGGNVVLVCDKGCSGIDTRGVPCIPSVKALPAWLDPGPFKGSRIPGPARSG